MKYLSTGNSSHRVSFRDAVINGMPLDGGLYMPEKIIQASDEFITSLSSLSYHEIGYEIAKTFIEEEIPAYDLDGIVKETLNFKIPVVKISGSISTLELFHGPTMAFKDIGAGFMARCLGYFSADNKKNTVVLVATSGDTGSAVAHGFYGVEGIKVVILYPSGKISEFQEKQMTTLGGNIIPLEVDGTFDDCQRLVKSAFQEKSIMDRISITSANSINIARLIPQIFYYFIGYSQREWENLIISVPSGNYGNLTAGLIAMKMGLPVKKFMAASNQNDIVPQYLASGIFKSRSSIQTISNAMDVGNPSNFDRIQYLYNSSFERITQDLMGSSFSDTETRNIILSVRDKYGYILDPHGAVGYLGLEKALENNSTQGLFLETAHPAKFREVIEPLLEEKIAFPEGFEEDSGPKMSTPIRNDLNHLKEILLSMIV